MRLWHKDLISVLPRQQLLAQWRECCCIARNIAVNGTPNHILVNKIMNYPMSHFLCYSNLVYLEMKARFYKVDYGKFGKYEKILDPAETVGPTRQELFKDWHNDRYYRQCYYNFQEKYDCGGLTDEEWVRIS